LKTLSEASGGKMKIIQGDVLKVNDQEVLDTAKQFFQTKQLSIDPNAPKESSGRLKLIGNLPFNVATPLIIKWLRDTANRRGLFELPHVDMSLMFQKEVAVRMVASESTKERSRLSIFCQRVCDVKCVYEVPPSSFVPEPKVSGTVVRLILRPLPLFPVPNDALEEVLRISFNTRRKMIKNCLKIYGAEALELIEQQGLDLKLRAENLNIQQFCDLTNLLVNHGFVKAKDSIINTPRDNHLSN